jgi:hypothetical protein
MDDRSISVGQEFQDALVEREALPSTAPRGRRWLRGAGLLAIFTLVLGMSGPADSRGRIIAMIPIPH